VTVVGAGVTGCACALALAARGVHVRVHEARRIASGASGRNGGFALRGSAMPYVQARAQLGADRAQALWRLTESALMQLEALAGDAFRRVGSLRLAADDEERELLADELTALRSDGFAGEWAADPPGRLGALYRGGIVHPTDGTLQPARWVRRLAERAADAGAAIVEDSWVSVDQVEARACVVAVDGSLDQAVLELAPFTQPVRGQMLATEPLAERLYDRPHYARHGYDYWQQLPDGTLLVGGKRDADLANERTAVEETSDAVQSQLEELVHELVGRRPRITHRWSGVWGETPDRLPLVGAVPGREGVWVAGGYSGHGNVLGLACGEIVARAVVGEDPPEIELFDVARFF
jgi:glycine/D-amino acid oxidase-like deaminating enzyme